jgi:hypothetical protein
MGRKQLQQLVITVLTPLWLVSIYPFINILLRITQVSYPLDIPLYQIIRLITTTSLFAISMIIFGLLNILDKQKQEPIQKKSIKLPLLLLLIWTIPLVSAYIFETNNQTIIQTILDLAALNEHFDDVAPGEDPPGWEEDVGTWAAYNDSGNIVYYQNSTSPKEALTISTSGNASWTDYTFTVDVKFDEGDPTKPERGALLVYRYSGGNDYYFLAMREAQDELGVYKHGTGGTGHRVGLVSFTLVQDTWYSVNITIRSNNVWISMDGTPYFTNLDMQGSQSSGSVGIGTEYYKVMFDNIHVELL